jgi:hypothetical protein
MNLAEQLLILALDPERGVPARGVDARRLQRGLAGAVLAELAVNGRLRGDASGVTVGDNLPDVNPLLQEAAARLAQERRPIAVGEAVSLVERTLGNAAKRATRSLVARDILHDYREAFVLHRNPVRSMQALREVHEALNGLAKARTPTNAAVALAFVADACGVLSVRMTPAETLPLRERLRALSSDGDATRALLLAIGDAAA